MKKLWANARSYLTGLGSEPTVVVCGASAMLVVSHYQGSTGYFYEVFSERLKNHPFMSALAHFWWFASSLVFYLMVPLLISRLTRGSFHRRYGLGLGDWRAGLKIAAVFLAVMLPAAFIASRLETFRGIYPLAGVGAYTVVDGNTSHTSVPLFLAYEVGYCLYFVGWEFLFRGWMVNGLLPSFGRVGAILVPVAPFAAMHLGKAELEALGSIIAAIALGILALRTRSIWYGVLLHAAVAVWMDLLSVWDKLFVVAAK